MSKTVRYVGLAGGRIGITSRPRTKDVPSLTAGVDHVVVLLSKHDDVQKLFGAYKHKPVPFVWFPSDRKEPMSEWASPVWELRLTRVAGFLAAGERVLVHCVQGRDRSGLFVFVLARWIGLTDAEALMLVGEIRQEALGGLLSSSKELGDTIAAWGAMRRYQGG